MTDNLTGTIAAVASAFAAVGSLLVGWRSWRTYAHNNATASVNMYYAQAQQLYDMLSEYLRDYAEHANDHRGNLDWKNYWSYRGQATYQSYLSALDFLCAQYLYGEFPQKMFDSLIWPVVQQICTDRQFWAYAERFGVSPDLDWWGSIKDVYEVMTQLGYGSDETVAASREEHR